jgi:hypothetical protein
MRKLPEFFFSRAKKVLGRKEEVVVGSKSAENNKREIEQRSLNW